MADPGWHGVGTENPEAVQALVAREGRFEPRVGMESDRSQKQVIPYLVLRDGPRYFLMRGTRAGGDARLHDRWSIGVGGHLNPGDGDLAGGLRPEGGEGGEGGFVPGFQLARALDHDTTDRRSVHLGAVFPAHPAGGGGAVPRGQKINPAVPSA